MTKNGPARRLFWRSSTCRLGSAASGASAAAQSRLLAASSSVLRLGGSPPGANDDIWFVARFRWLKLSFAAAVDKTIVSWN